MFVINYVIGIVLAINFGFPSLALGLSICLVLQILWTHRRDTAMKNQLEKSHTADADTKKKARSTTDTDTKKKTRSTTDISDEEALLFARNFFLQFIKFWQDNELRPELVYDEKLLPEKREEILKLSQYWLLQCDDLKAQMIARIFLPNLSCFQPNIGEVALGGLSKTDLSKLDHIEKNSPEYMESLTQMILEVNVPAKVKRTVELEREEIEMWFDNNNIQKRDADYYARAEDEKIKLAKEFGIDIPKS